MSMRSGFRLLIGSLVAISVSPAAHAQVVDVLSTTAEERALFGHVDHADIEAGRWTVDQLREAGRRLFVAKFTRVDGACRPAATGSTEPRPRAREDAAEFLRTAGPDANACASCHNTPGTGGAGDFVTNVFVGLGELARPQHSTAASFSNERGTPELHGAGVVEIIAREITRTLQSIRDDAIAAARDSGAPCRRELRAKGIRFGAITAAPDGELRFDEIEGIDHDLVVKPFGQKGIVISLREFTVDAANLHHGMQAVERFGAAQTETDDFDGDGVTDELTTGDITALCVFQATLPMPGQVLPADFLERESITRGEALFTEIKCAVCHVPELTIETPRFIEPGPFNARGTLCAADCGRPLAIDLSREGPAPRVSSDSQGRLTVRVFSDFKRHIIADNDRPHWANESVVQRRLPTGMFLTRRLWATGSTAPYGHRGDVTTIAEAIGHHGGEAAESRRLFEALEPQDRQALVRFLKSLQILPEGSPAVVTEEQIEQLPYARPTDEDGITTTAE
ncbi:MAG: di-heme oxidoredictase family protein [Planctomycetaceae bacterium]